MNNIFFWGVGAATRSLDTSKLGSNYHLLVLTKQYIMWYKEMIFIKGILHP